MVTFFVVVVITVGVGVGTVVVVVGRCKIIRHLHTDQVLGLRRKEIVEKGVKERGGGRVKGQTLCKRAGKTN